ncbi:MAG: ABC transporter permease subunit [Clostridia bacterium]|nr:ABC transporter permease subunit [Clostridia bacterium]
MGAVFKREFKSYFSSAIGWVFLTVFFFFSGLFFVSYNISSSTGDMSSLFATLIFICIFLIPLLTMRLMSDEKRQKTDQALLTAPIGLMDIVMGKFLAAFTIYAIGLSSTVVFAIVMSFFGTLEPWVIVGNIVGSLLMGAAFISVGIFISNLTESQIVAAVGSIAILLSLYLIQMLSSLFTNSVVTSIVNFIAISDRYSNFSTGIFNVSDALYLISFAVIFIFLTVRTLESRRWS